ncbi:MAG: hypothetical protein ABH846_03925, partial [Patescibacteria group bacterium]
MANDLPSIEDLLKQKQAEKSQAAAAASTAAKTSAPIGASTLKPEEQLTEKIGQIELKGLEAETERQAAALGVNYVSLKGFPISPDALTLIPEEKAKELKVVSFLFNGPELRIGAVNPTQEEVKEVLFQLEERNKTNGALYKISDESFNQAFKLYAMLPKIKLVVKGVQIKEEELERYQSQMKSFADIANVLKGASITDLMAILIAAALKLGSSDIHIEAEEKGI